MDLQLVFIRHEGVGQVKVGFVLLTARVYDSQSHPQDKQSRKQAADSGTLVHCCQKAGHQ